MRSDLGILPELGIDCDLSLFGAVEPFSIKHFSSKRSCLGPLKLCHYLLTKGVTENGTETVFG